MFVAFFQTSLEVFNFTGANVITSLAVKFPIN